MAAKPETTFTSSVHKHLDMKIYREKMANPYRGGTADMWYSGRKDMWVEYKFRVLPKGGDIIVPIEVSGLQIDWLAGRYAEGRDVAVIVGCKEGGVVFTDLSWNTPLSKTNFMKGLMSRKEIAGWIADRVGIPP